MHDLIDEVPVIFETTREAWLNRLVNLFRPYFDRIGYKLPEQIYVSVGYAPRKAAKALGVCFPKFKKLATGVGLVGKPSQTIEGPMFQEAMQGILQ